MRSNQAANRHVQDHCHGAKGEPEARRKHGPWIEDEYDEQGSREDGAGGTRHAQPDGDGRNAEHVKSSLRGHCESRKQRVAKGGHQAESGSRPARRHSQRKTRTAAPQPTRHGEDQSGDDGHVQT